MLPALSAGDRLETGWLYKGETAAHGTPQMQALCLKTR